MKNKTHSTDTFKGPRALSIAALAGRGRRAACGSVNRMVSIMLFLVLSAPLAAAVQVELDRSRIVEGETVTLTFRTDDPRQNLDADFSAIEKDFEILDRRSESQLSIVNGRQTALVRLLLTIEPRRTGDLEIPALDFGHSRTSPIVLRVDAAPALEPGAMPPVFIEVEIAPADGPYFVHAQFGLVVRVFYQQNLTEAAISQPEPSPASVRLLQETPYQAERGGERYRVLERNYAIFPERSGELIIPPMQLSGRLVERRSSNVWQPSVRGRRIKVESEALRMDIESRPAEFRGVDWQPAREFQLTQQISSSDTLRVGEPVTRTVIIDAVGLEENMIVEPEWPELSDVRIYPDQPQGITRDDGHWVLGHKEFRYAVVPEQAGQLILPELRVEWWDTEQNRQRTAVLPPHTLLVQPSALVPPAPLPATGAAHLPDATAAGSQHTVVMSEPGFWRWLTLLFAVLWLLTLLAALRLGKLTGRSDTGNSSAVGLPGEEAGLLDRLKKASRQGDRGQARRALQGWLREFGPADSDSLMEFARSLDDIALGDSVIALDSDGYRPDSENDPVSLWNGKSFWSQFESWLNAQKSLRRQHKPPITDLYATENRS